jgi:hypothetical protein
MRHAAVRSAVTALALAAAGCAEPPVQDSARDAPLSLAAAELAFAAQSVLENMRSAFMDHFAADGVFIRDGWVNANAYLAERPAPPIVLDWKPVYTETAASGEMGLSTGPWKLTSREKPDAAAAFGQFVSIWKRETGKPWKVAVDLGISHAGPALWDAPLEARVAPGVGMAAQGIAEAEQRFARDARADGLRSAYARNGSPRMRFYRDGESPAAGLDRALAAAAMTDEKIAWTVQRSESARSNDFGYARGSYASAAAPDKPLGHFLRVWRLEAGVWRIALDVTNPARS